MAVAAAGAVQAVTGRTPEARPARALARGLVAVAHVGALDLPARESGGQCGGDDDLLGLPHPFWSLKGPEHLLTPSSIGLKVHFGKAS